MKKLFFSMLLALMAISASAVPAKRGQIRTLTLADGTTVQARLVGDEYGHYWLADDGRAFVENNAAGTYVPANVSQINEKSQVRRVKANNRRAQHMGQRRADAMTGKKKGIIILVNFSKKKMATNHNQALFNRIANEKGYSEGNFVGSMHDYFYDQSLGKFDLTFDVVGPVTVSNDYSYYGKNSGGEDQYPATMVIEACKLANSQVNFADYDWDDDGYVDQVYVVYAGMGEADGGAANTIWPHEYDLNSAQEYGDGTGELELDGVTINTYACGPELNGEGDISGIGTMCHEFSHCLGYPDFYDTRTNGDGVGMFVWDLMDYGSYNGRGYQPCGYTSYERMVAGWAEPQELSTTQEVKNMKPLQESAESYVIYNGGNPDEYFLLENRSQVGWDASLPGSGLLILHVDYLKSAWENNTVNNVTKRQRMTWIPADNNYTSDYDDNGYQVGQASDLFPYKTAKAFNKSTTPAAKFYNKNSDGTYFMEGSVEDITRNNDGTVSFNYKGVSNVAIPTFTPKAGVYTEAQQVTIACKTEGAQIHYTTDGTTPTAESALYTGAIAVEATTTIKAVAVLDGELSAVATATYRITDGTEPVYFKLVTSTSDIVSGQRYVIACGSQKTAASALNGTILGADDVTINGNILTVGTATSVFTLEGSGTSYSIMNADGQYLYATEAKKVAFCDTEKTWTLSNGTDGVEMTYGSFGTMTYNVNSPRFTTYTSNATASMIRANLYMEYDGKKDVILQFEPEEVTYVLGEDFIMPTLIMSEQGLELTYTSSHPNVAVIEDGGIALTGELGTTVITASFAGNDQFNPASASYTLTVTDGTTPVQTGTGRYELITSTDDLEAGKNYLIVSKDNSGFVAYDGFDTNKGIIGDVEPEDNIIDLNNSDNKAVVVTLDAEGNLWSIFDTADEQYLGTTNITSSSNSKRSHLTESGTVESNYYKWDITIASDGVATIKNGGKDFYLRYNANNSGLCFRVYASGQNQVYLYKEIEEAEEPETIDVTITAVGYGTLYYSDKNLIVPEGVEASTYMVEDGKLLESWFYEAGEVIPAATGVVLKAEPATYTFTVTKEEGLTDNDNMLLGFDEAATTTAGEGKDDADYLFYCVNTKNGENVGFYWGAAKGVPFTSKAHKAYLAVPKTAVNQVNCFLFNDDTDSIAHTETASEANAAVYDLQGRRYAAGSALQKGFYIVNGKKMVIK